MNHEIYKNKICYPKPITTEMIKTSQSYSKNPVANEQRYKLLLNNPLIRLRIAPNVVIDHKLL